MPAAIKEPWPQPPHVNDETPADTAACGRRDGREMGWGLTFGDTAMLVTMSSSFNWCFCSSLATPDALVPTPYSVCVQGTITTATKSEIAARDRTS